ncbi:MAG: VOC family protein [Halobaculum sp.]
MLDGFHHASLAVADVPRAVSFYQEVLGFEPVGPDDPTNDVETATDYWLAAGADEWVLLADRPDATPDHDERDDPHLAFRADEAAIRRVRTRLTDRDVPHRTVETGVYFHDPAGNYLEVTNWEGPEP